ncbi:MAG: hypothetical protein ACYC26_04295 [Phycisphaerales bacterium]
MPPNSVVTSKLQPSPLTKTATPPTTSQRSIRNSSRGPVLRFTPYSWAKLQWFCHRGDTEIGGFAVTAPDDLLLVEDFLTVKQTCSIVTVAFNDLAVADFVDQQVDQGRKPEQFLRIWLHTHPGSSPQPSGTDEQTFARVFGCCDWAVMFILACEGNTYARLRFNIGPGGSMLIPVEVDYSLPFDASNFQGWEKEYGENIASGHADLFERRIRASRRIQTGPPAQIDKEDMCFDAPDADATADLDELALLLDHYELSPELELLDFADSGEEGGFHD